MVDMSLINKAELARRIGVSIVHLHYVLAGVRKASPTLKKVAVYLDISLDDLKSQIPQTQRQADAAPQHGVRANKSRPDRRPPAKNVPQKRH